MMAYIDYPLLPSSPFSHNWNKVGLSKICNSILTAMLTHIAYGDSSPKRKLWVGDAEIAHHDGQDKSFYDQLWKEQQDQSYDLKEVQLLIAACLNPEKHVSPPPVQNLEVPVEHSYFN